MNQSAFFSTLGAPVNNVRWSWGAVRPADGTVFLKIWSDQIETHEGKRYVKVTFENRFTDGRRNPGHRERLGHVAQVRAGARALLVLCEAVDPEERPRRIKAIETDELYVGGEVRKFNGESWIELLAKLPTSEAKRAASA